MLEPGTILLEKYRVERVLGQGGMGLVLSVRHVQLGELFAIKTLLPSALEQPEAMERFLREARACAKLKGEHVVRVHDVGNFADGAPYMLMEHLEGEDLSQVLERRGTLPVEEAALYVYHACEAVTEAHANSIVHRDLKPSNLFLIRRPNGTPCVKVLDFGISKALDQTNKAGANLTQTGAFLGSPMYMSPEQMADIKTTGMPGDVWALGLILYEFITGKNPFAAEAVTSVVAKVLLSKPEPPSTFHLGASPDLDAIVMRCLEKQPELRYPTAYELMAALQPFVGAMPSITRPNHGRSGSIPDSFLGSRLELVAKVPNSVVAPHVAMAETIAEPVNPSHVPILATSVADILLSTQASASTESSAAPPQTTVFAVPVVLDSAPEQKTSPNPLIAEKTNDALRNSDQVFHRGDPKRRVKIGIVIGVMGIIVAGLFALIMWGPTTTSTVSVSPAVSIAQDHGTSPTEIPTPELTKASADARSTPPNDSASAATMGTPTQATKTSPTAKLPSPAPISRPAKTKKSKVPGYDD